MSFWDIMGFVGVALNFLGVWLLSDGKKFFWIIWLFGSGLMGTAALVQGQWWPLALAAGYTVLNVRGLVKWIKENHNPSAP